MPRGKAQLYRIWPAFIENAHDFGIGIVWPDIEPVHQSTCLDLNLLLSASQQPFQECFGLELYPTLAAKAAYLFVHIAGGHIFSNGNKRTAILCLDTFLIANSRYLALTNDQAYKLAVAVASSGEKGRKFDLVLKAVTNVIDRSNISLNALKKIDLKQFRFAIQQKNWVRSSAYNQPDAPLTQQR